MCCIGVWLMILRTTTSTSSSSVSLQYTKRLFLGSFVVSTSRIVTMAPRKNTKQFEVESIVGKKIQRGKVLYEVKWKNYTDTTWEPEKNCTSCPDAIDKYNRELKSLSSKRAALANARAKVVKPTARNRSPTSSVREARSHSRTVDIASDEDEDSEEHVDDIADFVIENGDEVENGNEVISVPNEDPETWVKSTYRAEHEEVEDISVACFDNNTPKGLWFKCLFKNDDTQPNWEMTPYMTVREHSSRLGMDYFLKRHLPTS
ncbi:Chromobox-like protein [Aphelenchoides besseyi]|nr:Chromobox-like protein [Aphelenchoides besseyi]